MADDLTSRFRFVRLAKEELIVQSKSDDYEIWGQSDMTPSEYQAEEKLQRETAHSKRGLTVWALIERSPTRVGGMFGTADDQDDSDVTPGETAIVCHCESHTFDCMVRKLSGEVVRGNSYHVNAVYTLPGYRRQGLASFFLKEVKRQLAKQHNSIASVLYSDIDPAFYNQLGWETHRSSVAVIDVIKSMELLNGIQYTEQESEPLHLNTSLDALLTTEHSRLEASLQREAKREVFTVLPTRECLEWQFCSGVFHAYVQGYNTSLTQIGVQAGDSFLLWTHDFRSSTLYITYSSVPDAQPETVLTLLREAVTEASRFGLRHVEMWDPHPVLRCPNITKDLGIDFGERIDSISSLMLFKHVRDDPNNDVLPAWVHNERFAWV